MKITGLLAATLMLGLLIPSMLPANASVAPNPLYDGKAQAEGAAKTSPVAVSPVQALMVLPDGHYVIDTLEADVTGDGIADKVYLSGHKISQYSRYTDDLRITVINGTDKVIRTYPLAKVGGYRIRLLAGDFSGDKVSDVYVESESGGSGGWSYHHIVSFNGNDPQEIFGNKDNDRQSITGQFIDGFKLELTSSDSGKIITIDASKRQKDYLRLGIYDEEGTVIKETRTMTSPFSRLDPVDADNNGVFELKGIQRLSGAYRADGIADVETILKYDGTAWNARSVRITVNMFEFQYKK